MKMEQIKSQAKKMGISPIKIKKKELIQAIQMAENNIACYGSERVVICQEYGCLWRNDCLEANGKRSIKKTMVTA